MSPAQKPDIKIIEDQLNAILNIKPFRKPLQLLDPLRESFFTLAEAFFLGLECGGQAVQVADFGIDHRLMLGEL